MPYKDKSVSKQAASASNQRTSLPENCNHKAAAEVIFLKTLFISIPPNIRNNTVVAPSGQPLKKKESATNTVPPAKDPTDVELSFRAGFLTLFSSGFFRLGFTALFGRGYRALLPGSITGGG